MKYISRKRSGLRLSGIVVAASLLLGSCTKNFEKYNTDPNGLYTQDLAADFHFLGDPIKDALLGIYVINPAWNTQLQQNLIGDVYSGYMSSPTPFANNINNLTYSLVAGWNTYPWDDGYQQVMSPLNYFFKNATAAQYPGFYAVAKILKVEAMHRVSDIYGPIIYNKFGVVNADGSVSYDAQKDDYYSFFTDLDSAITLLKPLAAASLVSDTLKNYDVAYGGNYTNWLKLANTLKLRLAVRIAYADPNKAQQEGEAALANNIFLTSSADNFNVSTGSIAHPLNVMNNSWGDCRSGAPLGCYLTGYHDPRTPNYMVAAKDSAVLGEYIGIRQGINIDAKSRYANYGQPATFPNAIQLMTAAEGWFLRAEAAARNWAGAGDAKTNYETGIKTSFAQYGLDATAYLTDNTSTEAPYTDPKAITPGQNDIKAGSPWLSTITIKWDPAATFEQQLERIITQKWLAMYPDGQEAWTEFRRTGYPKLFPVVVNNSGGVIPTNLFIRRIPFASSEYATNPAGVAAATQLLTGGGPDNGAVRLWWDVAH